MKKSTWRLSCVWPGIILLLIAAPIRADECVPSFTMDNLDATQCIAYDGAKIVGPAPLEGLEVVLGLQTGLRPNDVRWEAPEGAGRSVQFRIAFKQPVAIGTLITSFDGPTSRPLQTLSGRYVSILKPGAAYPGDVNNETDWQILDPGTVKTLKPGTITRALRFSDVKESNDPRLQVTVLDSIVCLRNRYYSALNIGNARSSGSDGKPEIWIGAWNDPQKVVGLVFMPLRAPSASVEVLNPDATHPPLIALASEWRKLPVCPGDRVAVYSIANATETRGIRLTSPNWTQESCFPLVVPLVPLADNENPRTLDLPPPPFKVKYDMPMDGFVAIDILSKTTGQRVRHLCAEVARTKGPQAQPWDLKDDSGQYVAPGDYYVKGIARPPFKNTYELTPYNAGQPAWWAPSPGHGGGGWMADHTPPYCAEAMGDIMWLGSQVTEDGNAFIATDLNGIKLWGEHAVSWGFSGPERIATDGHYGYLVNNSVVQRVDPKNDFDAKTVYEFNHSPQFPGNGSHWSYDKGGATANKDHLYISYWGQPDNWLSPSFTSAQMDPSRCLPLIFLNKGKGKRMWNYDPNYGLNEYDEMMRLYAAFLTEVTPSETNTAPDAAIPSSTQAYFGDAPKEGPLAGMLTMALRTPAPVGSVIVPDARIKVYALKPGLKLPSFDQATPADVDLGGDTPVGGDTVGTLSDDDWIPFTTTGTPGQPGVALAPAGGVRTVALRFKVNRLIYALVTSRRFEDVANEAERVYLDGTATPQGGWDVQRPDGTPPINQYNPAIMGLIWPEDTILRGIALHIPTTAPMEIQVWKGNGDPKGDLSNDTRWSTITTLYPQEYWTGYGQADPTMRTVDFGQEMPVRALRFVAIAPAGSWTPRFGVGNVARPHRAGFQAIMAFRHLSGDPENLPVVLSERIDEFQLPAADGSGMKLLRRIPIKQPGNLTFGPDDMLYAVSAGAIVRVSLEGDSKPQLVVKKTELEDPSDITFDATGLLYVGDCGPKVIKVFDIKTGKLVRTLGKPGGIQLGHWDPLRFDLPTGLTIDKNGKLWITDKTYQPKRVVRMTLDGQVEKEFLGPTQYGGGGWLDEGNKNVLTYNGMKFLIDWKTMTWKLESILFRPGNPKSTGADMPDRPFYVQGRRYLVDRGYIDPSDVAAVCMEKNEIAVPMAAMGILGKWSDVGLRPDLTKAFGSLDCMKYIFVWYDKNGDGIPEADEVQIKEVSFPGRITVGEDLSFEWLGGRLRPTGFLPDGVPIYNLNNIEDIPLTRDDGRTRRIWATEDGRLFCIGDRLIAADGKTLLWEYYDKWAVPGGYYQSGYGYDRPPGVLNQEHLPIGHLYLNDAQGHKEEYFFTNSDQGDWFCFTGDGMLVGCIFGGPTGYGLRRWTMPDWEPGKVDLSDVRLGQEHYQGCVVKADDGNVYAVAGHNHASIVKIEGLEKLERLPSTAVVVTTADLVAASSWALQHATLEKIRSVPKVARMPFLPQPIIVNASLDDWPDDLFVIIHDTLVRGFGESTYTINSEGAMAYDNNNLYIAVRARSDTPFRNSSQDPTTVFKGGDAVDITLGLDPNADPKRKGPVAGDIRIILSKIRGKAIAVLYKPVDPSSTGKPTSFASPVGATVIDTVKVLTNAQVAIAPGPGGKDWDWICEAAIPWKSIGETAPKVGTRILGDFGILQADQNGQRTVNREYWSGKSQTMVADVGGEARLMPSLWGELYCTEPVQGMVFGPEDVDIEP